MINLEDYQALGQPVEIGSIDGELKKLWEADEANTNASLMNLIVYTEESGQLLKNSEMVQELTRENACRAVLIEMERAAEESEALAWITAHCHLAHGKKSICCEQVAIMLRGYSLGRLRNTAFAHLNSDLPLVFWWQGELSNLFEDRLYRLLNRLIVDSSDWADPLAGFQRILEAQKETNDGMVVQDLSWTRTFLYRLAVARLFDDPIAQQSIPEMNLLKVTANPQYRVSALLLVSWIMTRAGWKLASTEGAHWELRSETDQVIRCEFNWDEDAAPIAGLEMSSPDCQVHVSRKKGDSHLVQEVCSDGHCVEMSGLADSDEPGKLVISQLSRGTKNSLFMSILPVFMQLLKVEA